MDNPKRLIFEVVAIKNPTHYEKGFGKIVQHYSVDDTFEIHMGNGHCVFIKADDVIVQLHKDEALGKLKERIEDWYRVLPGCTKSGCTSCNNRKGELDEALNMIELLKVI